MLAILRHSLVPHVASQTGDRTACMELGRGGYTCVLAGRAVRY